MFSAHWMNCSVLNCEENGSRLCQTKKTELFLEHCWQNTSRFNDSENFLDSNDSTKFEDSKNRFGSDIWKQF